MENSFILVCGALRPRCDPKIEPVFSIAKITHEKKNHPEGWSWCVLKFESNLSREELDDELVIDFNGQLFTIRHSGEVAVQLSWSPRGTGRQSRRAPEVVGKRFDLTRFFFQRDLVADLNLVGRDVDLLAIHADVTVGDKLARHTNGVAEAGSVNQVVQTGFKV